MVIPKRYEVTDEQWERIADLFPKRSTRGRPPKVDNRTAFNATLWLIRSGAAWRDLPERYGPWKTIYSRFRLWVDAGVFEQIFKAVSADADMENVSLDSTSIRVHQKASGAKKNAVNADVNQYIGRSRGGLTTKIHAIVDGLGNPLSFCLSGGEVHDSTVAAPLLGTIPLKNGNVLADKAYGTQALRDFITSQEGYYTIPPKSNAVNPWPCDFYLYKERHLIEGFFNQMKEFRRIATRYDKLAHVFLGAVYVAAIWVWLK
ncbi:IS5 family transposase [Schleiferilactobacillus harbinensis]|uniref:IS5 family transposase n=1 Tax=Schleiferilactobacillus harbinensis TaxID=304207 RepID=UPI003AF4D0C6